MNKVNLNHTIGRSLKQQKGVYKHDTNNQEVNDNEEFNKYIAWLKNNGMSSSKVGLGRFRLENGLSYNGLIALEPILPGDILIKLPVQLLVTS